MQHFYLNIDLKLHQKIELNEELKHQCLNVLRYQNQQAIMLIGNNQLKAQASFNTTGDQCYFYVTSLIENPHPKLQIRLIVSLIKKERFEWMLQKASELGVTEIVPLISQRTQMHEHAKFETKRDRYQKIIQEACEQSEQFQCALLSSPIKIKEISQYKTSQNYLAFEREHSQSFKSMFRQDRSYTLVIGPEGGFSKDEVEFLVENGFISVSLGNSIYRTETAAIVFLSQLNLLVNS